MAWSSDWPKQLRRYALGVDIGPQALRLVLLSQRFGFGDPLRVEQLQSVPLPPGTMAGAEVVDHDALVRGLRAALIELPLTCATSTLRCAMALPPSATLMASVPLDRLTGGAAGAHRGVAALEPAVMLEAERLSGVERHALAIDWCLEDCPAHGSNVQIAATSRQHLEARLESAATAGVSLTAVDSEPHAALRALRFSAALELEPNAPYIALWVGTEGVFGWRIQGDAVIARFRYPSPEYESLADALREIARGSEPECVMAGGDLDLLDGIQMTLPDIGDVLGCTTLTFECAASASLSEAVCQSEPVLVRDPAYLVAFGLALRGVME